MTNYYEKFLQAQTSESPLCSMSPYQRFSIRGILIRFGLKSDIFLSENKYKSVGVKSCRYTFLYCAADALNRLSIIFPIAT